MLKLIEQSQNDFLREWVNKRETFLQLLLELEARSNDGLCGQCKASGGHFRCSDCIGDLANCHNCFMDHHKRLPFHRIQMWNGTHFSRTTLHDQGYILHLGHSGEMCPGTEDPWLDIDESLPDTDTVDLLQDNVDGKPRDVLEDGKINIVHTTGVFKHKVRWCQCPNAPDKTVQLFQMRLFPASHFRPETAFTFDVLDHFHIDAMECKTAAASFVKKLCRLTNNAFPHMVPVSFSFLQTHAVPLTMCRIGNVNSVKFQDSGGISGHINGLALATAQRTNLKTVIWLISVRPAHSLK
jgi:hypothetical protein